MGAYNVLHFRTTCPHCDTESDVQAEFKFGFMNIIDYRLGDTLRWDGGVRVPRRRPEGGNYAGDGYVECPNCDRDFWVSIKVQHDVIRSAEVNADKPGYIEDERR